jgi:hypothetical protein
VGLSENQVYKWYWDEQKREKQSTNKRPGGGLVDKNDDLFDETIEWISRELKINVDSKARKVIEQPSPKGTRIIQPAPINIFESAGLVKSS